MHNDRYIPLHPQLKTMLDDWLASRPTGLRSPYMFVDRGRRISRSKVVRALDKVAATAGIGHVTPHQLRHTVATQAINRGMSLEELAAAESQVAVDDARLRPHRGPNRRRRVLRGVGEGRSPLRPTPSCT